jgi:hypothetical protein
MAGCRSSWRAPATPAARSRFRIRAATLATFTPEKDAGEKTRRLALRLIDLIGEHAAGKTG